MLFDILMLFASAGLGLAATECREWAQRKAGERNHDIDQALLKAHQRSLKDIRAYCQKSPEWDQYHRLLILALLLRKKPRNFLAANLCLRPFRNFTRTKPRVILSEKGN
jgi:predicted protein tyrosine phosphatase